MPKKNIETSLVIEKSIKILNQLCKKPFEYKITELAKLTDINRTTLYRILNTLEENGLILKTKENKFIKIGPLAYEMGSVYLSNFEFGDKIFPVLDKISHESKESVGLAIRDGERVISLYEIEVDQPLKMNYRPGIFYPMNRGCYGKCLMAYYNQDKVEEMLSERKFEKICKNTLTETEDILKEYEKIRKDGYVISDDETFPFAVGVGIPIPNSNGEIKTCIAISFFKENNYKQKIENLKEILLSHKDEITKYII